MYQRPVRVMDLEDIKNTALMRKFKMKLKNPKALNSLLAFNGSSEVC